MVVLSTFVSLSILQRNSICVNDRFFAIIFAVGLIKTVHENLVAVKLIIVLWIRNPTPWLTYLPIFFFSLLYNTTLKPWIVSLYMDLNSVQRIAFGHHVATCWVLTIERAYALEQHCCTDLGKRLQHHRTSTNVQCKIWPVSNLRNPTNMPEHVATPNGSSNVVICFVEILRSFGRGFRLFTTFLLSNAPERKREAGAKHAGLGAERRAKWAKLRRYFSVSIPYTVKSSITRWRQVFAIHFARSILSNRIKPRENWRLWAIYTVLCSQLTYFWQTRSDGKEAEALQVESLLKSLKSW